MSDIFDGLGTASEGGLFARALEPDSGAKKPHPEQPENCKNCGAELTGAYCQACGQKGHVHRTISAFMHDLLHGALHFEGKLWRTLPMLVLRPGQLTRRYIDGERARFVSPMALFLFTVFAMFAIFQMIGLTTPTTLNTNDAMISQMESTAESIRENVEDQEERLAGMDADDPDRAAAEAELAESRQTLEGIEQGQSYLDARYEGGNFNLTGIDAIDSGIIEKWQENPGLMLYKLQANSYKFSWLLIPLSIPFVWITFAWRRRFKAYDHAIFVTYSLSFMTLLFIVMSIMTQFGAVGWTIFGLGFLIPPIHLYKQLRHGYELSRFSAFWRLLVISGFIWVVLLLFLQLLLMLGAF